MPARDGIFIFSCSPDDPRESEGKSGSATVTVTPRPVGSVALEPTSVTLLPGATSTLTATVLYPSQEIRDIVLKSGMEHGAAESYDKLAEMLAETPAGMSR